MRFHKLFKRCPVLLIHILNTDSVRSFKEITDRYPGKVIFIDIWATWCGPCRNEMPEIQKIYEETQQEEDSDLVILGIAAPGFGQEGSQEEIEAFLEENGYTYPVLMDTTGEVFMQYGISAYPTTFMVDKDGNLFGYVQGQLNEDMMRSIIRQTMEGKRE